jgi:hypothetical protein
MTLIVERTSARVAMVTTVASRSVEWAVMVDGRAIWSRRDRRCMRQSARQAIAQEQEWVARHYAEIEKETIQ